MEGDRGADSRVNRRRFLRLGGAATVAGSSLAVAACGGSGKGGRAGSGRELGADAEILNGAIDLERRSIAAYTLGLPRLAPRSRATARRFLDQEREHARTLGVSVGLIGGRINRADSDIRLPPVRDSQAALELVARMADVAAAYYVDAIPKISNPEIRAQVATILANEAEHLAVLSQALGRPPAPRAFVVGRA